MAWGEEEHDWQRPKTLVLIPARLGSTRMAKKMLRRDTGMYLFEHTVKNVLASNFVSDAVLATDSLEIAEAARSVGIEAVMTSEAHKSGTDRIHEALAKLLAEGRGPWDVVINVQGDEPELPPEGLTALVEAFRDPKVELATLMTRLGPSESPTNPSVVKIVCDKLGRALYFSRAPIPSGSHARSISISTTMDPTRRHVGVYAFTPDALDRFCTLPESDLERVENLEQLRWLENGGRIQALEIRKAPPGIDTEQEYLQFVARWRKKAGNN
jgi:3-deoxy-manno-octulosonate cytidylyltransferase (CMP-KDO synthetase)